MSTVVLVDLSSILYPLFHMSATEPDPDWPSRQAVSHVISLTRETEHVAICADRGRSFRKQIDPTYKANRPEKDGILIHQLKRAEQELASSGFPIWALDGYEADDVIASATMQAVERGHDVTIVSADKDLLQLVGDGVKVLSPRTRQFVTPEMVREKFGVTPEQMGDYLTLVGDSSDNIKGVPGIGPKKAAELMQEFGSLNGILINLSKLSPGTAKAVAQTQPQLPTIRSLITLRTDAELPFDDILKPRVAVAQETSMAEPLDAESILDAQTADIRPDAVTEPPTQTEERETALAKVEPMTVEPFVGAWERQLEPRTLGDARVLSKWLHASRLFAAFGAPEAVLAIILAGRELGLGMMASLRGFHVIEGKPVLAADLIRAVVLKSGKAKYFICTERTTDAATWETQRDGDPHPVKLTFSWSDAQAAGVQLKGRNGGDTAWVKHRPDMLAKSASSKLARLVYADVTFGLYGAEEMGVDE